MQVATLSIHSVLLHMRLVTRLIRVLGAGREGGGVGGQVERKKESESEGGEKGRIEGGGGKREKEKRTAEIKANYRLARVWISQ